MLPPEIEKKRTKTPEQAYNALARLCSRAEKTEEDARRLMYGWGVNPAESEKVVARLVREQFIDNSRYAEAFVREKLRLSGWGEFKIRAALQRKRVSKEIIDNALMQVQNADMGKRLRQQLEKKAKNIKHKTPYELKTKLIRYALSLGYDYETVIDVVDILVTE